MGNRVPGKNPENNIMCYKEPDQLTDTQERKMAEVGMEKPGSESPKSKDQKGICGAHKTLMFSLTAMGCKGIILNRK